MIRGLGGWTGPDVASICNLLINLLALKQPLVARHAAEALTTMCLTPKLPYPAATLAHYIDAVSTASRASDMLSSEAMPSLLQFLEAAFPRCRHCFSLAWGEEIRALVLRLERRNAGPMSSGRNKRGKW